ncbi:MAG: S46 family peptidase [Bacteroidales bacterium]|nr:S46 family peptidase [Bacteroidales bacterium]
MIKFKLQLFIATLLFAIFSVKADEGMWLPYMLNNQSLSEMQRMGCRLTADQIFSLNQPSIKDAIVQFGGGCTGEVISAEGLLLTNHHCGLGQIQKHSSLEHDYLQDGFWSMNKKEELPNPGLTVSFLNHVEDVTDIILDGIEVNATETERDSIVTIHRKNLAKERKGERDVRITILPFYKGNQYILFEYIVYRDVRLVACPPWGIGKFGADTDNWTWPRHKGDFCMFRVYTAPDGSPAEFSENNIPLKPKHFLPISLKGVETGDYAMILGYPGSTDRYSNSQAIQSVIEDEGPAIIACRTTKLNNYRQHMDADPEVFIKYASKQAGVSNYWKYYIGQVKQLQRNKVYDKRITQETAFQKWAKADPKRSAEYGDIFESIQEKWAMISVFQQSLTYHIEAGLRGSEAVGFAMRFVKINRLIEEKAAPEDIAKAVEQLQASAKSYFKDYDKATDYDVTIALLNLFYNDIDPRLQPELLNNLGKKNGGDFTKFVDDAFAKTIFTDAEKMNQWLEKPKSLSKDPIFDMMLSIRNSYFNLSSLEDEAIAIGKKSERLYMKGLMEMEKNKIFYPDANFTMRLTYGEVSNYQPADAVTYNYFTTLDGVMAKEQPGNWEFDVPKDLKKLWKNKDYGRYADKNGNLVVNFITTNDITGGNSGSPVLDGNGNLIGLAFDGNWEAMSGDLSFENEVQRTICMDIRYLLFIIDKMANAQNIMQELKIVE